MSKMFTVSEFAYFPPIRKVHEVQSPFLVRCKVESICPSCPTNLPPQGPLSQRKSLLIKIVTKAPLREVAHYTPKRILE